LLPAPAGESGDSIAHSFVKEGASLVLAARTREQQERVAAEIKTKKREAVAVACDVSSPREVERLAKTAQEKFGRVDILVNNVGISRRSRFLDYEDETWLEVIRINHQSIRRLFVHQGVFTDDTANGIRSCHQHGL